MEQRSYVTSVFKNPLTREVYTRVWIELITALERGKRASG